MPKRKRRNAAWGAGTSRPTSFTAAVTPTKRSPVSSIQAMPSSGRSAGAVPGRGPGTGFGTVALTAPA